MPVLRTCAVAMLFAAVTLSHAYAGTRDYLFRGMGGAMLSTDMDTIGAKLRRFGHVVWVVDYMMAPLVEKDASEHPRDRINLIGHSAGARAAADVANDLIRRGIHAHVIGIDPLCMAPAVVRGIDAVNFYGNRCPINPALTGAMTGAHNVDLSAYGLWHIPFARDPRVQARVIAAALR